MFHKFHSNGSQRLADAQFMKPLDKTTDFLEVVVVLSMSSDLLGRFYWRLTLKILP